VRNGQPIQSSELCPQWPWCAIISHHLIKDKSCLSLLRSKPFRLLHHVVLLTHACHCLCLYIHIGDEFWTVWESMIPRKENVTSVQTFWPHTLNSCQLSSALYRKVFLKVCLLYKEAPIWHHVTRRSKERSRKLDFLQCSGMRIQYFYILLNRRPFCGLSEVYDFLLDPHLL